MTRPSAHAPGRQRNHRRRLSGSTYVPSNASAPSTATLRMTEAPIAVSDDSDSDDDVSQIPARGPIRRSRLPGTLAAQGSGPAAPASSAHELPGGHGFGGPDFDRTRFIAQSHEPSSQLGKRGRGDAEDDDLVESPQKCGERLKAPMQPPVSIPNVMAAQQPAYRMPLMKDGSELGDYHRDHIQAEAGSQPIMSEGATTGLPLPAGRPTGSNPMFCTPAPQMSSRNRPHDPSPDIIEVPGPNERGRAANNRDGPGPAPANRPARSQAPTPVSRSASNAPGRARVGSATPTPSIRARGNVQVTLRDGSKVSVRKRKFLDHVREEAAAIFKEAATHCLEGHLENRFKDYQSEIERFSKAKIIHRYDQFWSDELEEARESIKKQLDSAQRRCKAHKWQEDADLYQELFVDPLEKQLDRADRGIAAFKSMMDLLKSPEHEFTE